MEGYASKKYTPFSGILLTHDVLVFYYGKDGRRMSEIWYREWLRLFYYASSRWCQASSNAADLCLRTSTDNTT